MQKAVDNNMVANPLGYEPISKLIRKYAVPSIISLLVAAAYNITDQIFIGHVVGLYGNAATNVAFPVTTLTVALSSLIGVGTATNFNINMGAKRYKEAANFLGTGLALISIIGVVLMAIVLPLTTPILRLSGATTNVLPYAEQYLTITAIGIPFLLFSHSSSILIRADGSPFYSLVATLSGAVLNVFLDYLFMFVFKWGIKGAAIATVIGQFVSFIFIVLYFPRFKSLKIKFSMLKIRFMCVVGIVKLGTSNFINHFIMMLVNIVMNNNLAKYGALSIYGSDIPLAVSGVIAKLNSILTAFVVGLAQGCQPILGFNMGAKNYSRVKETYKKALFYALVISVIAFIFFQAMPRQIVSIFGVGTDLYFEFATKYMRIFMLMVFTYGVQPISINYFTGIGSPRQGITLSLSRQGFFLVPMIYILPLFFGINGILYAGPIADILAAVLSLILVMKSFKNLTQKQKEQKDINLSAQLNQHTP